MKHLSKILLWLALILPVVKSQGQSWLPSYSPEGGAKTMTLIRGALHADSAFVLPTKKFSTPYFTTTQMIGAIYINMAGDSSVYFYNGVSWINVLTPSTGVTNIATAYGILGGPITTTGTLRFDSSTVFPNLVASFAAGYGLSFGGRTYKADTSVLFPAALGTLAAGTGISISNRVITNTSPDVPVVMTNGYGITITGTYPNFTVKVDSATVFPNVLSTLAAAYGLSYTNRTFKADTATLFPAVLGTLASGTGISISNRIITNTSPDQTVVLTAGYGITPSGTYPNFTITADTATLFVKLASTFAAGYGMSYANRTYTVDTATLFPAGFGTFAAGAGLSLASRTFSINYAYAGTYTALETFGKGIALTSLNPAPSTPATGVTLYSNTSNQIAALFTNGFAFAMNGSNMTASRTGTVPDHSFTFDNLSTSTTTSNGYFKGVSGLGTFVTSIPNADLANSSLSFNGHTVSLGSSGTITVSNSDGSITVTNGTTDPVITLALAHSNTFSKPQICTPYLLTDAATVAVDLSQSNNFYVQLGGNRTLGVPTNIVWGQKGSINIWQDLTGTRTLAYAWVYSFAGGTAPTLTTTAAHMDKETYMVDYYATSTVTITIAAPGVVSWTAHGLFSGMKLQLTTTGALPTGLTASTTYYVSVVDANSFKLCTSLANVTAGTFITTTGSQSGTHTATACSIFIGSILDVK